MSDWLNVELEAVELAAEARERFESSTVVNGRCSHGFVIGLCSMPKCVAAVPKGEGKSFCRACGKKTRLDRERLCAACIRVRKRKGELFQAMEAAE